MVKNELIDQIASFVLIMTVVSASQVKPYETPAYDQHKIYESHKGYDVPKGYTATIYYDPYPATSYAAAPSVATYGSKPYEAPAHKVYENHKGYDHQKGYESDIHYAHYTHY